MPLILSERLLSMYPGTELNRHSPCGEQDFKSGVSTNSTTWVSRKQKIQTAWQFGSFVLSGRPGSNRPPRPWQGRALPNELLPLVSKNFSR